MIVVIINSTQMKVRSIVILYTIICYMYIHIFQEDVLEYSGIKRLLEMAVEGFSCTVFCYGQTGSGKTHTLTGPPGLVSSILLINYKL